MHVSRERNVDSSSGAYRYVFSSACQSQEFRLPIASAAVDEY